MTWLWIAWLLAFCIIEGYALVSKREGDTLSEHVWAWFAIGNTQRPVTPSVRLRRFILLAFMAWLTLHFITGGLF